MIKAQHPLTEPKVVTPLFKKGDKSKASNTTAQFPWPICSKAMEHIIHSHLMKYLDNHHILSDQQHGFRRRRSCESQLITTVHDLASRLDLEATILMDFICKMFDKVAHLAPCCQTSPLQDPEQDAGLDSELPCWQIPESGIRWQNILLLSCYFWGSTRDSTWPCLTPDIYQRSLIQSLLYNTTLRWQLPALQSDIKPGRWSVTTRRYIDHFQEWERDWQMVFNPDKCKHIRITNKRKIVQSTCKIHSQVLKETTKAK